MKILKHLVFILSMASIDCFAQSEMAGKLTSVGIRGGLAQPLFIGSLLLAIFLISTTFKKSSGKKKFIAFVSITFGPLFFILGLIILHNIIPDDQSRERDRLNKIGIEAKARFKELCDAEEGEKTYEQLKGVKSFLIKQSPGLRLYEDADLNAVNPYLTASEFTSYSYDLASFLIKKSNRPNSFDFCERFNKKTIKCGSYDEATQDMAKFDRIEEYSLNDSIWQIKGPEEDLKLKNYIPSSKYALSFEHIESVQDRSLYAIVGIRFKITEISTNKLIAAKTVFMKDQGLGTYSGTRFMWLQAKAYNTVCPKFKWGEDAMEGTYSLREQEANYIVSKWIYQVLSP